MTTATESGNPGQRTARRSQVYHLVILGSAAIILVLGGVWRGASGERSTEGSEISAIEALRKEVSGVQSALRRNELEAIQDAMKEITTSISPSVVGLKPADIPMEPFRNIPIYGISTDIQTDRLPTRSRAISGLIIDREGHILTSASVAQYAVPIQVLLGNSVRTADLISTDTVSQLGLVKLRDVTPGLIAANLNTTAELRLGEWLVREGRGPSGEVTQSHHMVESIQTTASGELVGMLSPEGTPYMEGAALINEAGRIAGIYVQPSDSDGFVVPIRRAIEVATKSKGSSREPKGWAGIQLQDLSPDLQDHFGFSNGVLIASIEPEGPAAKAGLRPMDLIEKVNEGDATSAAAVMNIIAKSTVETPLSFVIRRNSRQQKVELTVSLPSTSETVKTLDETSLVLRLVPLPNGTEGAAILSLQPQAAANRIGIRSGDLILAVDGRTIRNPEQFWTMQIGAPQGKSRLWTVRRGEKQFFVAVKEPVSRP